MSSENKSKDTIQKLNLASNGIVDKGVEYLGQFSSLEKLDLSQNLLGRPAAKFMMSQRASKTRKGYRSLKTLPLKGNLLGERGTTELLASGIQELDVEMNDFEEGGSRNSKRLTDTFSYVSYKSLLELNNLN